MAESLGVYVSIPFCRGKCSFCHFASDVFPLTELPGYVDRLCCEIAASRIFADRHRLTIPDRCDSVFLGGGTPSLLSPGQVQQTFTALRESFAVTPDAEITVEVAPGQLDDDLLESLLREGVNRISLGVQSFIDREAHAVGRLHSAEQCREEVRRLQKRGVQRLSLDLILGLPHQTRESWHRSLQEAIDTGVDHLSIYMLDVDEGSRLGRELIGPGVRYGAGTVPDDATIVDCYAETCESLAAAGLMQYEISNFAREAQQSRHNRKYWERRPYLGFGLDAHSMLRTDAGTAVRFRNAAETPRLNQTSRSSTALPPSRKPSFSAFVSTKGSASRTCVARIRRSSSALSWSVRASLQTKA